MDLKEAALNNLIWLILIVMLIPFALIPGFFDSRNLANILSHSVFIGLMAIGEAIVLISGGLDLATESTLAFTAMLAAWLMGTGAPASGFGVHPAVALAAMLLAGGLIGLLSGIFIVKFKMEAFIVTLAGMIILRGATILFTNGQAIVRLPKLFRVGSTISVGSLPLAVLIMFALYILFWFVTTRTVYGRHLLAVGGNDDTAFAFGIKTGLVRIKAYVISGVLSATAGWLLASRMDAVTPSLATGMGFEVISAAVIGGVSLSGGSGSLVGVFGGVLLLGAIDSALNILAVNPYYVSILRGVIIFLAVFLDAAKRRSRWMPR